MHQFRLFILFTGFLLSGASLLTAQEPPAPVEPALTDPAAIVNGTAINYASLKRAQRTLSRRMPSLPKTSDKTLSKEELALEQLISRQLLYEAAVAQKITIDSNQVDDAFTRFLRSLSGPRAYQTLLSELSMTEKDLKGELAGDLTIEAFINKLTAKIRVAPEKIKHYYNNHPHLFSETAKIRFREIYLPKLEPPAIDPELEKTITNVQTALDQGVDFIRIADRHTPAGEIKSGGDSGYVWAGSLKPDLEDRLFTMEIDAISGPIETEVAVLFIKIVDKQVEQLAPFPTVKKEIENFLLAKKRQVKILNFIEQLKSNAKIERLLPIDPEPDETVVE